MGMKESVKTFCFRRGYRLQAAVYDVLELQFKANTVEGLGVPRGPRVSGVTSTPVPTIIIQLDFMCLF